MKKPLKNIIKEINDFFEEELTYEDKAWGIIDDFYHYILTYIENKNISRAELARRLGKSRSYVSQIFKKNPNMSILKMVQIADAVGINLRITCDELLERKPILYDTNRWSQPPLDLFNNIGQNSFMIENETTLSLDSDHASHLLQYN